MALDLYIPPCMHSPRYSNHLPSDQKPLRIQIEGPLSSVKKLVPDAEWNINLFYQIFPQPAGTSFARCAFAKIYGRLPNDDTPNDLVVRDEYMGWVMEGTRPLNEIDYYGVTFDHLVPSDDDDPEVLQINMLEMDYDNGAYANNVLPFHVDASDYTGKKVLAVPRCCQKRKGTQDRWRINFSVIDRERLARKASNKRSTET